MSRLPIMHTLSESLNVLLREWRFFVGLIIGPVLVLTGTLLTARFATQSPAGIVAAILLVVVVAFSSVRIAVCCHRFILLRERPSSFIQGCKWEKRDTWFALYGIGIYLFAWFFILLAALGVSALSPFLKLLPESLVTVLFALGIIAMLSFFAYLMGRLSLILPATAIDRRPAQDWMDWAWSRSEGNEWPLMFLLGVNPTLGWIMLDASTKTLIEYANQSSGLLAAPMYGLMWGLYFIAAIFQVAVLSFSEKQLSVDRLEDSPQKCPSASDLNFQTESPA